MASFIEEFGSIARQLSISQWGIGDIADLHPLGHTYPRALSILWAYSIPFAGYTEIKFHELLHDAKIKFDQVTDQVSQFLSARGIKHLVVPQGGQDSTTLLAIFPHKLAATRGGLGWIGKGSFLVSPIFGPRVRLATILMVADVPCGQPVTASECGECQECVKACPYNCIHGTNWYPGIAREELLDAHLCNLTRESYTLTLGHKHECGLCLLACPIGK